MFSQDYQPIALLQLLAKSVTIMSEAMQPGPLADSDIYFLKEFLIQTAVGFVLYGIYSALVMIVLYKLWTNKPKLAAHRILIVAVISIMSTTSEPSPYAIKTRSKTGGTAAAALPLPICARARPARPGSAPALGADGARGPFGDCPSRDKGKTVDFRGRNIEGFAENDPDLEPAAQRREWERIEAERAVANLGIEYDEKEQQDALETFALIKEQEENVQAGHLYEDNRHIEDVYDLERNELQDDLAKFQDDRIDELAQDVAHIERVIAAGLVPKNPNEFLTREDYELYQSDMKRHIDECQRLNDAKWASQRDDLLARFGQEMRQKEVEMRAEQDAYFRQVRGEHRAQLEVLEKARQADARAAAEMRWSLEQSQKAAERAIAEKEEAIRLHLGKSATPVMVVKSEPVTPVIPATVKSEPPAVKTVKRLKDRKSSKKTDKPKAEVSGAAKLVVPDSFIGKAFAGIDHFERKNGKKSKKDSPEPSDSSSSSDSQCPDRQGKSTKGGPPGQPNASAGPSNYDKGKRGVTSSGINLNLKDADKRARLKETTQTALPLKAIGMSLECSVLQQVQTATAQFSVEEDEVCSGQTESDIESVYDTACEDFSCESDGDSQISESGDTMEGVVMEFGPHMADVPLGNLYAEYAVLELTRYSPYPGDNPPDDWDWAKTLERFSVLQTEDGYVIYDSWRDWHADFEDGVELCTW
ncbi:hypothetical protein C8J56DRAFT_886929 [Mycena floridula]|nr:hypothetical protein C8J56DRAFT_886929 [Mycena floridula]